MVKMIQQPFDIFILVYFDFKINRNCKGIEKRLLRS